MTYKQTEDRRNDEPTWCNGDLVYAALRENLARIVGDPLVSLNFVKFDRGKI